MTEAMLWAASRLGEGAHREGKGCLQARRGRAQAASSMRAGAYRGCVCASYRILSRATQEGKPVGAVLA